MSTVAYLLYSYQRLQPTLFLMSGDDFEIYDGEIKLTESEKQALAEEEARRKAAARRARELRNSKKMLWQTRVRETVSPYLPPPVLNAIKYQVDPALKPYMGPEGTVTLTATIFLAWFVTILLRLLASTLASGGRAVSEGDDEVMKSGKGKQRESAVNFSATVLLVGPSGAGKTRLFYCLCHGDDFGDLPTVSSLKANVDFSAPGDNSGTSPSIRYMDWPGLVPITSDKALQTVIRSPTTRVVLVVDSTQPVAAAADYLDHLFSTNHSLQSKKHGKRSIVIACHKSDAKSAKNWRRIKIQLRNEMERLLTVKAAANSSEDKGSQQLWWPVGKPIDFDDIPGTSLRFISTSSVGKLSQALLQYCQSGDLPAEEKD